MNMKTSESEWFRLMVVLAILAIACPVFVLPYLSCMRSSDSTTRRVAADLLTEIEANAAKAGIGVSDGLEVILGAKPSEALRVDGVEFRRFISPDGRVLYAAPPGVGYFTDQNGVPVRAFPVRETDAK